MNITSAKYDKPRNDDGTIIASEDNCNIIAVFDGITKCVPIKAGNPHYDAIVEWVADGNTIADAD